jgi:hypothetical protein
MNRYYECLKIYVIMCQQEKYYVGKTTNFARRYQEHKNGTGSAWTLKYPPIDVVEVVTNIDKYDEDKYVWKYMEKYGIDNVRGGSYSQINLSESLIACATRHINGAGDLCFGCGNSGHFVADCTDTIRSSSQKRKREDESGNTIPDSTNILADINVDVRNSKVAKNSSGTSIRENSKCFRCGRTGHWKSNCYAATHISGRKL